MVLLVCTKVYMRSAVKASAGGMGVLALGAVAPDQVKSCGLKALQWVSVETNSRGQFALSSQKKIPLPSTQ
jgi:hypothetical protein